MNHAKIYLCKADCSILGIIDGIKAETCSLTRNATDLWEMTFTVDRFVEKNGQLTQSNYYDSIDDMMKVYLDSEEIQALFVIDSETVINGDGIQETKTITVHSIESELCHVYLKNFKANCGTYDSQEFLVTDEYNNLVNNINAYNANTMKWITLVNYDDPRYSLMHLVLQNTDWKVKKDIPKEICDIQKSFETSNSVYAFLMKDVSSAASVIFEFNRKHKEINIIKAEDYGKDTGVFITMRNLMNSFEVTSSSDDAIITKLIPVGANNISIEQVNFGNDYVVNLDYFMNTLNEYGDYKYVSKELHDKYASWKNYRDGELVQYTFENRNVEDREFLGTRRELYRELTKEYNGIYGAISNLINRVPNDGCCIDYGTYSLEELNESLIAYNKALFALLTLYKNDIIEKYNLPYDKDNPTDPTKSTQITINDDYSLVIEPEPTEPISPTLLPNTDYWYDYYAYKYAIIPKIEEAIKAFDDTDYEPKPIDSYLYEWELYGVDELEAKKKAWYECENLLFNNCFIASGNKENPIYRTANDTGWDSLTPAQQSEFTSKDAFINQLNQYLDYMSLDEERENSLTKTKGMGIIRQCERVIAQLNDEIDILKKDYGLYDEKRTILVQSVDMKLFTINGEILFNTEDINIINSLLRTKDYSNEYILTTNLDDVKTTVNIQEELYQDAIMELEKISQPQYSFNTELDNIYSLEEFKSYREPFDVGNFIRVGLETHEDLFENKYIKLRLISITHNPLEINENLSIEFSTMTKSLNTISDLAFLLDEQNSSSGSGSSSNSSSGVTYGNNDVSVQMSNTMLNALLKTELFGTAVNDVILDTMKVNKGNFNNLFSHSGAFDSLEAGQVKVSGDCLFDRIKSRNWNGTKSNLLNNTEGSILDLSNGKFNFAGGKLKWDGETLSVVGNGSFTGDIIANSLKLGDNATVGISSSNLTDANKIILKDLGIGNKSLDYSDVEHNNGYVNISSNGLLVAENAIIHGTVYATDGKFTGEVQATSGTFNGTVNATDGVFNGEINANKGSFTGDITATTLIANQSGCIAGWNFNESAFYKNDITIGNKGGFYIGENGISIGDYFIVNNDKFYCKNKELFLTYGIYGNSPAIQSKQYCRIYLNNIDDFIDSQILIRSYSLLRGHDEYGNDVYHKGDANDKTITLSNGYSEWDYTEGMFSVKVVINGVISYIEILSDYFLQSSNYNNLIDSATYEDISSPLSKYDEAIITFHIHTPYNDEEIKYLEIVSVENTVSGEINHTDVIDRTDFFFVDTQKKMISSTYYDLLEDNFKLYNNYSIKIVDSFMEDAEIIFKLNKSELFHSGLSTSTSGNDLVIYNGNILKKSSSSLRYKNSIQPLSSSDSLSPHSLYDLDVVSFQYNDDYISESDQRYKQAIPGFIAEDVYEKYPIACNLDAEGRPEMWDINILFPVALKLIQEQHKDIEFLKEEINKLK